LGATLCSALPQATAILGPSYAPDDATRAAQVEHLKRLKAFHRYPGSEFGSPDELAKQIAYSTILDLLVADYAEKAAREREVAEGIHPGDGEAHSWQRATPARLMLIAGA
jgi:hypothetical protein